MARFSFVNWARVALLVFGLAGIVGCAGTPRPIAAQVITPPLVPATPAAALSPTPALMVVASQPTETLVPTSIEVAAMVEPSPAPFIATGQHAYLTTVQIANDDGSTRTVDVDYLLYLPGDYGQDPQRQWPLILFLHGAGERGYDPQDITRYSIPASLTTILDFPFIVLSPQSPPDDWWSNQVDVLDALLNQVQAAYAVDPRRIYLTGQSMGGFGTWAMALKYPARFAAIVPVASGYDVTSDVVPANICDLKDVPIWVFHGALDESVLPDQVTAMVQALQDCSGNVRFTLYPDADHLDSSNRAYADPELYEWLLKQVRP